MDRTFIRWQEVFKEVQDIDGLDSRFLYEQARPCFYETNQPSFDESIGVSRIGGLPDLPATIAWPIHEGRVMSFLAQVNCSELESGFTQQLPQTGWLYFFMDTPDVWMRGIPHHVIYFDGPADELRQITLPQTAQPPNSIYKSYPLAFETGFTLRGNLFDQTFQWHSGDDSFETAVDLFQRECTRLGGHPMSFQPSSGYYPYLAMSGFDLMYRYGSSMKMHEYNIERRGLEETQSEHVKFLRTEVYAQIREYQQNREYHDERMKDLHTIFVLSSNGDDMIWGDLGFLQFVIFEENLEKRDFSHTWCDLIST